MAEINLPPVEDVPIDRVSYESVAEVRRVLQHFQFEPHGDLTLNAERAAFIAVFALRDAGLLATPHPLSLGEQPHDPTGCYYKGQPHLGPCVDRPSCQDRGCRDAGDPDFGEATCPSEHADLRLMGTEACSDGEDR